MIFYVLMCVSWSNEIFIIVIMIFIGTMLSFIKFRGQMPKNVEDVLKLAFEMCMYALNVLSVFEGVASVFFCVEMMWKVL